MPDSMCKPGLTYLFDSVLSMACLTRFLVVDYPKRVSLLAFPHQLSWLIYPTRLLLAEIHLMNAHRFFGCR